MVSSSKAQWTPEQLKRLYEARNGLALALGWLEPDTREEAAVMRTAIAKGWDAVTELVGDEQWAPGVPTIG